MEFIETGPDTGSFAPAPIAVLAAVSAVDARVCSIGFIVSTPARRKSAATDTTSDRPVTLHTTTTGAARLLGSRDLRTHATTSGFVSAIISVVPARNAAFS